MPWKPTGTPENPTDSVYSDLVNTDDASITKTVDFDHSEYDPHPVRTFHQSGTLNLRPYPGISNPVIDGSEITDFSASWIADPFMRYVDGTYHLFAEAKKSSGASIVRYTSADGVDWTYQSEIFTVNESDTISWPLFFKWDGSWYLTPAWLGASDFFRIYRIDNFPPDSDSDFTLVNEPISSDVEGDPAPFVWDGRWYVLLEGATSEDTELYYSDSLDIETMTMQKHPSSPISSETSRPDSRAMVHKHHIDIAMEQTAVAGDPCHLYRITDLSPTTFSWTEIGRQPLLTGHNNGGWNSKRMHHLDYLEPYTGGIPLCAVDGQSDGGSYSIGIYTLSEAPRSLALIASNGTAQTVSNASFTTIEFNRIDHDTEDAADLSNNSITIPESGYYQINCGGGFDTSANAPYRVLIEAYDNTNNRKLVAESFAVSDDTGYDLSASASKTVYLEEGAEVILRAWHNSGGTENIADSPQITYLGATRVR